MTSRAPGGSGRRVDAGPEPVPARRARPEDGWPRWRVFPPIALGVIMATLDASVVNMALPTLQRTFHSGLPTVEWVALAYLLVLTGLQLASGRLADARGRRRVYGLGLAAFTLVSVLCGLAPSIAALIALRVLQGIGAALIAANGSALLVQAFPAGERGRALGAFGAMVGVGLALGPPLGGFLVAHASWRWIFFVNLPLGILASVLLSSRVPADGPAVAGARVPVGAALLWSIGLAALMLALTRGPADGWTAPRVLGAGVAGVALLAIFLATQSRGAGEPLLPLDLVAGPLGAAVTLTFLGQVLAISVGFHMPLFLEEVGGLTAAQAGAWLSVLPVAALFCAPVAGRLADRVGPRALTVAGMALTGVGMWFLAGLGQAPLGARLGAGLALVGIGQGLFSVPNASALLSLVPPERLGLASGLQGTTRNLGLAAGVAFTGAMMVARYRAHAGAVLHLDAPGGASHPALAAASRETYLALAAVSLFAAVLAWTVRSRNAGQSPA